MTPYPAFGDDPARWGLLPEAPMSEAEADAAGQREAWGDVGEQSTTACCPRETIPDSCSCPDGCDCACLDCTCGHWGDDDDFPEYELP
jgi:hypothetical protein